MVTNPAVTLAALIAERVHEVGLSQRQWADLVGVSPKHVNLVFNGRATANSKTLAEWAEALGIEFVISARPIAD